MDPAQNAIDHGDQRQERDQHAADVQRQVQSVARALRRRIDHVDGGLFDLDFHLARGGRIVQFRDRRSWPA